MIAMEVKTNKLTKITTKELREMVRLYGTGLSCNQLGKVFGLHRTTVRHHLKSRGVEMKTQWRKKDENNFHRASQFDKRVSAAACMRVQKAVKLGFLIRPKVCETCGEEVAYKNGKSGIHAHHPDYNFPLRVMWLCRTCHFQWHKFNRAIPKRRKPPTLDGLEQR